MIQENIALCHFRLSLTHHCRAVKLDKKQLTVTYNGKPYFRVLKISVLDANLPKVSLTFARDKMADFIDLLEQNGAVILTAHGKEFVKCELIK